MLVAEVKPMKTTYTVTVRCPGMGPNGVATQQIAVTSPHYAVREVLWMLRGHLPRGWKRLTVEVTR